MAVGLLTVVKVRACSVIVSPCIPRKGGNQRKTHKTNRKKAAQVAAFKVCTGVKRPPSRREPFHAANYISKRGIATKPKYRQQRKSEREQGPLRLVCRNQISGVHSSARRQCSASW
jgi:hypothetical protein